MCHMLADTPEELLAMADRIGVQRRWFQNMASTPHFDIAQTKRALAVAAGAVELNERRELADLCKRIRATWPMVPGKGWLDSTPHRKRNAKRISKDKTRRADVRDGRSR
jgi:hypothetical protein